MTPAPGPGEEGDQYDPFDDKMVKKAKCEAEIYVSRIRALVHANLS